MSTQQTFSTNDLRSASVDYKRDSENKHKWAQGEAWGPGRPTTAHSRPARLLPRYPRSNKDLGTKEQKTAQRREIVEETAHSGDSSAEDDPAEPSAAPALDADVAYSFDARAGPSHGSQILSLAVARAVERYESNVTDKVLMDEYEVLDDAGESVPAAAHKAVKAAKKAAADGVVVNEDEYEFV